MDKPVPHPSAFSQPGSVYLLDWAEEQLAKCREQLESAVLDAKPEASIRLRARIGLLKDLLAIPEGIRKAYTQSFPAHTTHHEEPAR